MLAAALAYAFEHIARETKAPAEQVVRVITEVGRAVGTRGLVGGQVCLVQGSAALKLLAGHAHILDVRDLH